MIGFLTTAVILLVSCGFVPKLLDNALEYGAKEAAYLTKANEADWKDIPGKNDIGIYWNQYMYNCTNAEEVVYTNAKAEFQEFGPFIYRESDTYTNLDYSNLDN